MPLTQVEADLLRRIARTRIIKGQLPSTLPRHMWGGKGAGHACALCNEPVEPSEMEIEIEQRIDGRTLRFHVVCQSMWQLECAPGAASEHHAEF